MPDVLDDEAMQAVFEGVLSKTASGIQDNVSDSVHKESVKCYRNVQAVVEDNSKRITDRIEPVEAAVNKRTGGIKGLLICILIFLIMNFAGTALLIAHLVLGVI